jgi:hypothetical protein
MTAPASLPPEATETKLCDELWLMAADDQLWIKDAAGRCERVEPVRAFPISDPAHWLALVDAQGKERALVADPQALPQSLRQAIDRILAQREFLPQILRVVRIWDRRDPAVWEVVTDRGPVTFLVRDAEEIRRLGPHQGLIVDVHGVRYLIRDSRQLDPRSQRILSRYL